MTIFDKLNTPHPENAMEMTAVILAVVIEVALPLMSWYVHL
jgi:hypothetical protein